MSSQQVLVTGFWCHNCPVIVLTDDDFEAIFRALEFANSGWTDDDVPHLVALEAKAWSIVQAARARQDT